MLKLSTFIALFVCLVYSNNEHNVDSKVSPIKFQLPIKQDEENKNTLQTIKGHYVEESQTSKPCKNKNRRLGDKNNVDSELFESLPLSTTLEQVNTASVGNKIITSSIHSSNYKYKNENTDLETNDSRIHSKNNDCDNCLLETNKKVIQFESLSLGSNPFNNATIDIQNDESELAESKSNFSNTVFSELDEFVLDDKSSTPLDSVPPNNNTDEHTSLCKKGKPFKNTRRKNCGRIELSENLSTKPATRRILPGIIDKPTNQELEDNKLYQDSPQSVDNDGAEVEARQNYFPNVHRVTNTYDIDLVHNMNINEASQQNLPVQGDVESQLIEPTRGKGIYDMKEAGVMLLENSRVCYACSTMSDPTCWTPDRRTTVKYCQKGHKSCLTKTFKHKGKTVVIRDCGSHCVNLLSGEEKYSSCSVCHSDLCNGASSISIYSTGIAIIVFCGIMFNTH